MSGANVAGAWDLLLGPMATLAAAFATRGLRSLRVKGLPVAATLPPVLLNAVVVGLELTFALFADPTVGLAALNMLLVGLGQLGACTVCGLILYTALVKTGAATAVFGRYAVESR